MLNIDINVSPIYVGAVYSTSSIFVRSPCFFSLDRLVAEYVNEDRSRYVTITASSTLPVLIVGNYAPPIVFEKYRHVSRCGIDGFIVVQEETPISMIYVDKNQKIDFMSCIMFVAGGSNLLTFRVYEAEYPTQPLTNPIEEKTVEFYVSEYSYIRQRVEWYVNYRHVSSRDIELEYSSPGNVLAVADVEVLGGSGMGCFCVESECDNSISIDSDYGIVKREKLESGCVYYPAYFADRLKISDLIHVEKSTNIRLAVGHVSSY